MDDLLEEMVFLESMDLLSDDFVKRDVGDRFAIAVFE